MINSLRYYRKKARLTLKELGVVSGLAHSTIGNVETGISEPGPEFIQKVCKALKISEEEFLSPPPKTPEKIHYAVPGLEVRERPDAIIQESAGKETLELRLAKAEEKLALMKDILHSLLDRL